MSHTVLNPVSQKIVSQPIRRPRFAALQPSFMESLRTTVLPVRQFFVDFVTFVNHDQLYFEVQFL